MKLKRDYNKIHKHLEELGEGIWQHLVLDITNFHNITRFKVFDGSFNFVDKKSLVYGNILKKEKNYWRQNLETLLNINSEYIKSKDYHKLSPDELKGVLTYAYMPLSFNKGLTPEMMILYYYGQHLFKHENISFLADGYKHMRENFNQDSTQKTKTTAKKYVKFDDDLKDYELKVNSYLDSIHEDPTKTEGPTWDMLIENAKENFHCDYDPETKTFYNLKGALLAYINFFMVDAQTAAVQVRENHEYLLTLSRRLDSLLKYELKKRENYAAEREKTLMLERRVKNLERETTDLRNELAVKPVSIVKTDQDRKISELEKENYYLKHRISDIENELAELEQEKEINKSIGDVTAETQKEPAEEFKRPIPENRRMIISGGFWTSERRKPLIEWADSHSIDLRFVPAEETLRRFDLIRSADLVIMDTSCHAHPYTLKIKEKAFESYYISKSNAAAVTELFSSER